MLEGRRADDGVRELKSYGQQCPVTRALDLIGDRWTLVIVRDLLDGPRRFNDLRRSLVGISPSLLSARLDRLTEESLVGRRDDRYVLTERGASLAPVIDELGRWGVELMGRGRGGGDDVFLEHFLRLGFRFVMRPEVWPDRSARIDVELDGVRSTLEVRPRGEHPRLVGAGGAAADATADVAVRAPIGAVYAVRRGRRSFDELVDDGVIEVAGRPWAIRALRDSLDPVAG